MPIKLTLRHALCVLMSLDQMVFFVLSRLIAASEFGLVFLFASRVREYCK